MDQILNEIMKLFPQLNAYFMTGFLIFARLLGFFRFAPVFCRKEIPALVKIPMAILVTFIFVPLMKPMEVLIQTDSFILSILLKFAFSLSIILCNILSTDSVSTSYVAYSLNPNGTAAKLFNLFILSSIFFEYHIFT